MYLLIFFKDFSKIKNQKKFQINNKMSHCLLLNADASPVSLLPLSLISWEEAIKYMVLNKAVVLEWYHDWEVRSANWSTKVPAVLMLKQFMRRKTTARFSKQNIFLRDRYQCQYCEILLDKNTATIDHVLPVSQGGENSWENCVTACWPCNAIKGNRYMMPNRIPYKPSYFELINNRKKMLFHFRHPAWKEYLI
jgi:5-methylcytosine-specific restriction endonuclease McrA